MKNRLAKVTLLSILAAGVAGLLSGCANTSKSKVIYHYSDSVLDAKSQGIMDSYRSRGIRLTDQLWDVFLQRYKDESYASYAGAVPPCIFKCDTSSIYDADGYRTFIMEKDKNYVRNIIYVHGGAWTSQIAEEHLDFLDIFIPMANAKAYMPLYPMLPHYSYAETMKQILSLYQQLLQEGKPLMLMGDSAGGNIILGFINYLKEKDMPMPTCVMPISPAVNLTGSSIPGMQEYENRDPLLSSTLFTSPACKAWAGDRDLADPVISPIYGDLQNFPPMFMFIGTEEILYPECISYAEKVADAGARTEVLVARGLEHVAITDNSPITALYCTLALDFMKSVDGK